MVRRDVPCEHRHPPNGLLNEKEKHIPQPTILAGQSSFPQTCQHLSGAWKKEVVNVDDCCGLHSSHTAHLHVGQSKRGEVSWEGQSGNSLQKLQVLIVWRLLVFFSFCSVVDEDRYPLG